MPVVAPSDARSPRRSLPTVSACALLALAASALAAAQASAAGIIVPEGCVVNKSASGTSMPVDGNGFTPGDSIALTTDSGGGFGKVTVGADGTFQTVIAAPLLSKTGPAQATFTLTATDTTAAVPVSATTTFQAANLAMAVNPFRAKPGKKVTYTFSGFTSGAPIYAHYVHAKHVTATHRFGRAKGPCGVLKKKATLYPGRRRFTRYRVQFDDSRHYSAKSLPRWVTTLLVLTF